jgi:CRP/FNR family transcriptional regulator, cyclic AMP receptor protein
MKTEDPLSYLPGKRPTEIAKGERVYGADRPAQGLYLAVSGVIQVVNVADNGSQTVMRLVAPEMLFGEASLLGAPRPNEEAVALRNSSVMFWPVAQVDELLDRVPGLGLALTQVLLEYCSEMQCRIESMAHHKTPERVAIALLQMAAQFGRPTPEGMLRIPALTHHVLAGYVGTSREIVTVQMNRLRRLAFVTYTRKDIEINTRALGDYLREGGIAVPLPRRVEAPATLAAG